MSDLSDTGILKTWLEFFSEPQICDVCGMRGPVGNFSVEPMFTDVRSSAPPYVMFKPTAVRCTVECLNCCLEGAGDDGD